MFTDISGYTALAQKDETAALRQLARYRDTLRPVFLSHNGREVKTIGDGFLVEFHSSIEAVRCAVAAQKALLENREVKVRIGIHLGDVVETRDDVQGDAVNVASRIEGLAEPGGVCVTAQLYESVHNKMEYEFESIGRTSLKNVEKPVEVYSVVLPWTSRRSPARDKRRIAVLPFANISPDSKDEYFADGMTEETISTLSAIHGLSVISRTSVLKYRNPVKTAGEISRELGARVLLEGSVRKWGNKLRITVQLIDAEEDKHLWSATYDREMGDVFAVQAEIAKEVSQALQAELLSSDRQRIERSRTSSTEAYTSYLRGRYHMNKATMEEWNRAIECFETAVREDQEYADPHAAISECCTYLAGDLMDEAAAFTRAKEEAAKAVGLDPSLPEAHLSLGIIALQHDWNWAEAGTELEKAIELNPSYSVAHMWYGLYQLIAAKSEEGISEVRLAESLDPLSPLVKLNLGTAYYHVRLFDLAESKTREALALEDAPGLSWMLLGLIHLQQSRVEEALSELNRASSLGSWGIGGALGYAQAVTGGRKEAMDTLARLKERDSQGEMATVYAGLGEIDSALEALEKSVAKRESWPIVTYAFPFWDPLRPNPRYARLLQGIGLAP